MYRVTTYYSIKGLVKSVDLSDFAYGEWIIYETFVPKYHINIFDTDSISNVRIKALMDGENLTIESIVNKINVAERTQLSLENKPAISLIKKSELIKLDLKPLPENWVLNIS